MRLHAADGLLKVLGTDMAILKHLNDKQAAAAMHSPGPALILAGAGSGKTRVLAYRIAHLVMEQGIPPRSILAVTFTNKAAREMKERLERLIGPSTAEMWLGTFHSVGLRILKENSQLAGVPPHFTVYDNDDQIALIKESIKELNLSEGFARPKSVLAHINRAKNENIPPTHYKTEAKDFYREMIAAVYKRYQEKLRKNCAFDFGDLICEPIRLFQRNPSILKDYQSRFIHMLVDEYQDTNRAQYHLINLLTEGHRNLYVVGDPDQSIYGWRGADISNILDFHRDFPDATVYKLEQNYRSTGYILKAADSLVRNNLKRMDKTLWTAREDGEKVTFRMTRNEYHEAETVAGIVTETMIREPSRRYSDFAVFYRTNAQSRVFEEYFLRHSIPYTIVGGLRFYERREIKDSLAYLRLIVNPGDSLSLKRIINTPPRGVGKATFNKVSVIASETKTSLYEAFKEACRRDLLSRTKVPQFIRLLEDLKARLDTMSPHELFHTLIRDSGYLEMWEKEKTDDAESRIENLHELGSAIRNFEDAGDGRGLPEFLDQVALISDVDGYEDKHNRITMMTLHSAKGLEFPIILMVGMEEGLFPHARSLENPDALEEERRLCYVGMTRAMERLYLFAARQRTVFGEPRFQGQSVFIDEISPEFIEIGNSFGPEEDRNGIYGSVRDYPTGHSDYGETKTTADLPWRVGMRVRHRSFGTGMIKSVDGVGESVKLTVAFDGVGPKKLMVNYAPLVPLED